MESAKKEIDLRIEKVINEKFTYLDLSGLGISVIPETIYELDFLIEINLSYNYIDSVSNKLFSMKMLRIIDLQYNRILDLDINLNFNYSIREINISNNFLYQPPILR